MNGPVARSQKIQQLLGRGEPDPAATEILAVAVLHERDIQFADPGALVPGSGAADEADHAKALADRIVPQFQPAYIPAGAGVTAGTRYLARVFRPNESLDAPRVNQTLAVMLADVLTDEEVEHCAALSLSGDSPALGATRFGVVTRAAATAEATAAPREGWLHRLRHREPRHAPSQPAAGSGAAEAAAHGDLVARLESFGDPGRDPFEFEKLCLEIRGAKATAAVPALIALLGRPLSGGIGGPRTVVIGTLGVLGDARATEALIAELANRGTARSAIWALEGIRDERAVAPLQEIARGEDGELKEAAEEVLDRFARSGVAVAAPPAAAAPPAPTTWHVEPAGPEVAALTEDGQLSERTLPAFTVLRVVAPEGAALDRDGQLAVSGTVTCACGYEAPLDVRVGVKGPFDAPSKASVPCPRCNGSTLVVGTTTGTAPALQAWLLATQEAGAGGAVVAPGGGSGRPELEVDQVRPA
jgi:hypothetical protein